MTFFFLISVKFEKVVAYTQHSRCCNSSQYPPWVGGNDPYRPVPANVGRGSGLVSQDGAHSFTQAISVLSRAWLAQQAWLSRIVFGAEKSSHARRSPTKIRCKSKIEEKSVDPYFSGRANNLNRIEPFDAH
jgi:hypothetical protein